MKKETIQTQAVLITLFRGSRWMYSVRKGVLRNFTEFTEKHQCQRLFFYKVAGLRAATILKKRLWHRCFPVNFAKFLRTPFLWHTSQQLLLTFNRCWFKKPSLLMRPFRCLISNFEKKTVLLSTKNFFARSFHSCKLFHERVSFAKIGT